MLKFFKRRRLAAIPSGDRSLAIGDLLEQPALQAVMTPVDPDDPMSLAWARLIAAGPITFDSTHRFDHAA